MKYLITGGLGFIGSNFILRKIEQSNHKVLNYDKKTYAGNYANLKKVEKNKNYQFILGDISDFDLIFDTIKNYRPDVIINFAAESHVDRSIDSADEFINTNVVGTVNLLKASMSYFELLNDKSGFKFMHISTDEVFGDLDANGFFKENSLYNPSSPYSASKASSDHFVRAWHKTYGLPILISNCSNNFGPFQFPEKLIPLMIIKCINRQSLPIY
ncbi:MAG: dTDP-glucose 4,6-dehydratase, partial [Candidatus Marinimicrobia bacterium]|nr:dTDP-glucose 4,6-dehydratase [Candidatus Neomarinimicrobiota bacterium]